MKEIIKKLFSIKHLEHHTVLRILGIRIKYKKKTTKDTSNLNNESSLDIYKAKFYGQKSCFLCGSKKLDFVGLNPDFKNCYIVRCKKCGFMFNVFEEINTDDYYEEEYRKARVEHITQKYVGLQDKRARAQFEFIRKHIDRPIENMTILEIGCSVARLLKKFEVGNNALVGYEADIEMAKWAKDDVKGTIINSMCDIGKLPNNSYDLIILSHVFEHLDNPIMSLQLLLKALKPNGHIFIEIPNENLETVKFMCANKKGVGHYTYFSVKNLQALIKKFPDIELIKLETYTMNINDYVSKLTKREPFEFDMGKKIKGDKGIHIRCLLKKRVVKNV